MNDNSLLFLIVCATILLLIIVAIIISSNKANKKRAYIQSIKNKAVTYAAEGQIDDFYKNIDLLSSLSEGRRSPSQEVIELVPLIIEIAAGNTYISESEDKVICSIIEHYNLQTSKYDRPLQLNRLARHLLESQPLTPCADTTRFIIQKSEIPFCTFDVKKYVKKIKSVRKNGRTEHIENWESQGGGSLLVTNKRVLFNSNEGAQSIKLEKIIGIDTSYDFIHISLETSSVNAKMLHFKCVPGESRFIAMFISNIDNLKVEQ